MVEGEGDKTFWTKIGAAWAHQDGKDFNIQLSCLPVNGRLVLRDPKVAEDDEEAGDEPRRYAALPRPSQRLGAHDMIVLAASEEVAIAKAIAINDHRASRVACLAL